MEANRCVVRERERAREIFFLLKAIKKRPELQVRVCLPGGSSGGDTGWAVWILSAMKRPPLVGRGGGVSAAPTALNTDGNRLRLRQRAGSKGLLLVRPVRFRAGITLFY